MPPPSHRATALTALALRAAAMAALALTAAAAAGLHGVPSPTPGPEQAGAPDGGAAAPRRDVVLIVTDDQPWHTVATMPRTNEFFGLLGVRFVNGLVSTSICCPSRASILTGRYAHNHRVLGNSPPVGGAPAFEDASTIATWLRDAGYRTGLFGKYLNAYDKLTPWPYVPPGWTDWHALKSSAGYFDYDMVENGAVVRYRGKDDAAYSTNALAEGAVAFIRSVPPGVRLFLYFTPYAPHPPATPALADEGTLASLPGWRSEAYNEADVSDKPLWVRKLPLMDAAEQSETDALYRRQLESLQAVDRAVGRILDALAESGRLADAAIVFTSDNGYSLGEHRWVPKNCAYDGCVRVPFLVRAPGALPRSDGNLVMNIDLAPTIAEWAGVRPPKSVNGRSLVPLLANPLLPWREEALLEILSGGASRAFSALRSRSHLYVEYQNGDRELYDLPRDPYQLDNRVSDPSYAAVVAALEARLEALKLE